MRAQDKLGPRLMSQRALYAYATADEMNPRERERSMQWRSRMPLGQQADGDVAGIGIQHFIALDWLSIRNTVELAENRPACVCWLGQCAMNERGLTNVSMPSISLLQLWSRPLSYFPTEDRLRDVDHSNLKA
jgi:hypothetical protein